MRNRSGGQGCLDQHGKGGQGCLDYKVMAGKDDLFIIEMTGRMPTLLMKSCFYNNNQSTHRVQMLTDISYDVTGYKKLINPVGRASLPAIY